MGEGRGGGREEGEESGRGDKEGGEGSKRGGRLTLVQSAARPRST